MTRNHKAISLAMALVFCLSFLAPLLVAPAAADAEQWSYSKPLGAPWVSVENQTQCGSVRVLDTAATITTDTVITVVLNDGAEFSNYYSDPANATGPDATAFKAAVQAGFASFIDLPAWATGNQNTIRGEEITVHTVAANLISFSFDAGVKAGADYSQFEMFFGKSGGQPINVNQSGDVTADITVGSQTFEGVVIARSGDKTTTTVGLSHPSVAEGNNQKLGAIKISESATNTLQDGAAFVVVLPDDVTFVNKTASGADKIDVTGTQGISGTVESYNHSSGRDAIKVTVSRTGTPTGAGILLVDNILVNVDSDCANGDIIVDVSQTGTKGTITTGTAWIGVKGDYTVTVEQGEETVPTLYAGQYGVKPGTIRVSENAKGTLVSGRSITFELPANAYWTKAPEVKVETGDAKVSRTEGTTVTNTLADSTKRKLTYNVTGNSTRPSDLLFHKGEIALYGDAEPGELLVTVAGTAGVQGEVLVANIAEPVTVNVDPVNDVIIGLKNQQTGTVTITEAAVGLIRAKSGDGGLQSGVLKVILPEGCSWTVTPNVEVTAGDLKIDANNVTKSGTDLSIPIKTSSKTTPSVITISGIELTLNRTVPEGTLVTGLRGAAIDNEHQWQRYTTHTNSYRAEVTVVSFTLANCVTPAPTESVTQTYGTFTLGSSIYYVNGMAKLMDVAVFAQDGRIFVPQRFLGLALGIPDENIVWDQATQTATFTTLDGKVIVFTVGSNIFTVDGVEFTMDVTPQVVDGRICLPVRFMVEALGGTVGWDQATQTAFFNL